MHVLLNNILFVSEKIHKNKIKVKLEVQVFAYATFKTIGINFRTNSIQYSAECELVCFISHRTFKAQHNSWFIVQECF